MKKNIFILCFLAFTLLAFSQDKVVDSLLLELNHSKNDIDKTIVLNAIANQYKATNPDKMLDYANKALQLSKKIKYKVEEGNAILNIGTANIILGNYKMALDHFILAQNLFENESSINSKNTIDIKKGLAKSFGSIGIVMSEQSNYSKALEYYLKSVRIYETIKDQEKCAKIYNNIGIVYKSQNQDFKALEYFIKTQKIQQKIADPNIGITLTNIGNCYLKELNFPQALNYYTKAKQSFDRTPNPRSLGEWYNNLGLYYKATKNNDKAIENWKLAIATFQSIDDKFGIQDTYRYIAELNLNQKNHSGAIEYATKSLELANELDVLEQKVLLEKLLSDIYSKQNNTNLAFQHLQLYTIAKDSLTNIVNTQKGLEAAMNYELEKRESIHKQEIQEKEILIKEQSKRNTIQLIFAGLLGLLLFGIGFLIYNRAQLKKTLTLQKELAEYEQKALHLQMNPHFVFNCLGSISSFIVQNGSDSAVKYLAKFSKLMRLTLEYSKEKLIPIDSEIESLQNYLELEQLRFNNKFNFIITKNDAIEDDVALPPLLIQPIIENAIIHGVIPNKELGKIVVDFKVDNESLICTITDNGIGINKSKQLKENSVVMHKSMAMDITKKRLQMMESTTNQKPEMIIEELIDNNEIKGTKIILKIPIQYIK